MSKTGGGGRLGNQIIRNLATSIIAEKHNLKVTYEWADKILNLGIDFFSGEKEFARSTPLLDDNYFAIYNLDKIDKNIISSSAYFQTKEISNLLCKYLHDERQKIKIIEKNPYKDRYNANNDLLIHIRLTDVAQFNPGLQYYLKAIKSITFDKLFIATDQRDHNIIQSIMKEYPSAELVLLDEVATFQFASTCKHILLSHGSFSTIIGYLSYFSNIYYPEYENGKIWYGDTFSIEGWKRLPVG